MVGAVGLELAPVGEVIASTCDIFVDFSVTIVIFVVTRLTGWELLIEAGPPDALCTGAYASFAQADSLGRAGTCVTGFLHVFIDIPVTVIIFVVTDLLARKLLICTCTPDTGLTGLCPGFADSDPLRPTWACVAGARYIFIDFSVTVVIFVVADLCCGDDFVFAEPPLSVHTCLCTVCACPCVAGVCGTCVTCAFDLIINLTVTVIILVVTRLGFGDDFVAAITPLPTDTCLCATFTDPDTLCALWSCITEL